MPSVHELLSAQFYEWESRGRGITIFPEPVSPEPPFEPFPGHFLNDAPVIDDGVRPTFLSTLFRKLSRPAPPAPPPMEEKEEPEAQVLVRDPVVEIQVSLPAGFDAPRESFAHFLSSISLCRFPIAFEIIGTPGRIAVQFAVDEGDVHIVRRQLQTHFPEATFQPKQDTLLNAWVEGEEQDALVVEFGLEHEFMLPLATGKLDPFVGLVGALSELQAGELALFQVIFEPVQHPWAENIVRSVTHADGKPFFVNMPELAGAAEHKVTKPLFAAVVRIALKTDSFDRTLELGRDIAGALRIFSNPEGNSLIPLQNSEYPFDDHVEDMLRRQSRRPGMILNCDELTGFVHLPGSSIESPSLVRDSGKTKAAPGIVRGSLGILLGNNTHADLSVPVRLSPEQRVRHMHLIGASGTGKSTLLFNLIRQDIDSGQGVAVLDPHGDLVNRILTVIPPHRIGDVVLVDPSDEQYSVGFNILSAHSDLEKNLLASDLVSVFQRLSTSWGDQMGSVLQNAILAFLESEQGGTLSDLRKFLIEPAFRDRFLTTVRDPDIVYYWRKAFVQLSGNKSIGSVLTRLETFLSPKPIRYMVSQPVNRLDFADILDSGKIFLAKLPQGQMGKENSFLLGSLLVAKFQQLAMGRQAQKASDRRDFWLYLDEFHNFITPSMAEILTGARKYRLGLILAHQELRQLDRDREVSSAVLSNPFTRVVFRVGDSDAKAFENGFSFFEARDLQNLETGQAICRVEKADGDFNLSIPRAVDPTESDADAVREAVIAASRAKYATPRAEIERAILAKLQGEETAAEPVKAKPTPPPKVAPVVVPEVPKPPVPEKKDEPPPPPIQPSLPIPTITEPPQAPQVPEPIKEQVPPRDMGRGGAQHQAIQRRLKEVAEKVGFRSTVERPVLDGKGSVDLYLERGAEVIGCEISISTTIDHEVGNVTKCLKAGIQKVAVICLDQDRLAKIQVAVVGSIGTEVKSRVLFFEPDQFVAFLESLSPPPAKASETKTRRGYSVKSSVSKLSPTIQKQQEDAAIRAIADVIRKDKT